MSCCHYDEGYEDGRQEAKEDSLGDGDVTQAIRDAARLIFDRRGEFETADVLRACADEIDALGHIFTSWCLKLKEREATLALAAAAPVSTEPTE